MTDAETKSSVFTAAFKLNETEVMSALLTSIHYFRHLFVIVTHGMGCGLTSSEPFHFAFGSGMKIFLPT